MCLENEMRKDTCISCEFWKQDDEIHNQGECRVRSPVCLVIVEANSTVETHWPVTDRNDWCGEFKFFRNTGSEKR